ncbi:MAG TPA: hypothetical protein VJR46_08025 [Candidatus Dormibacteraeota bacterium]|nr:hypothetical protein [Candidatus Dormibacteraeota bacterium]
MRSLIRSPLTWAVVAEMIVVGVLLVLAWNVIGSVVHPGLAVATPAVGASQEDTPLPDIPTVTGEGARGPMPGLNVSSAFWRRRLAELNRDQAIFAQLEWRLVHAGMDAARDYVEGVVLPAIRRAERAVG